MAARDLGPEDDFLDNGSRRCSAKSKQRGERCKNAAIRGGTVCRMHGGGAPQVRRKARLRLAELVDPSIAVLGRIIASEHEKTSDRLRAAENVLDRSGYPRSANIEVDDARELLRERLAKLREEAKRVGESS